MGSNPRVLIGGAVLAVLLVYMITSSAPLAIGVLVLIVLGGMLVKQRADGERSASTKSNRFNTDDDDDDEAPRRQSTTPRSGGGGLPAWGGGLDTWSPDNATDDAGDGSDPAASFDSSDGEAGSWDTWGADDSATTTDDVADSGAAPDLWGSNDAWEVGPSDTDNEPSGPRGADDLFAPDDETDSSNVTFGNFGDSDTSQGGGLATESEDGTFVDFGEFEEKDESSASAGGGFSFSAAPPVINEEVESSDDIMAASQAMELKVTTAADTGGGDQNSELAKLLAKVQARLTVYE